MKLISSWTLSKMEKRKRERESESDGGERESLRVSEGAESEF